VEPDKPEEPAYDHNEEIRQSVRDLSNALEIMDRINPPDLPRPKTEDEKKTVELIEWSIRVYTFGAFCQFREILRSTLTLISSQQVPVVLLCCRGLFELAAHAYYMKEKLVKRIDKNDCDAAWELLLKVNFGSRYRHKRATDVEEEPAYPNGIHINDALEAFNEYFPDGAKLETAEGHHDYLSEFCHPNSDAFTNHFDWEEELNNSVVKFGKPDPELMMLGLPDAAIACSAFLRSAGELLERVGERASFIYRFTDNILKTIYCKFNIYEIYYR
jgi:hypothetical protein